MLADVTWLADTQQSYDTVAANYAELVRGSMTTLPVLKSVVVMFAELARGPAGGAVIDVGCGPGQISAVLQRCGLNVVGIDLSPAMIHIARREHPGPGYAVGSMTDLPCADGSAAGVLLFWSLIHIPDESVGVVLSEVFRVLRPGGVTMIGFHVGDRVNRKTEGYGGLPMQLDVHLRPVEVVADRLRRAGFTVEATMLLDPDRSTPGGVVVARRPSAG
jgi:ubiquinone/menaquinone biosynthesis C-methylase UbiE